MPVSQALHCLILLYISNCQVLFLQILRQKFVIIICRNILSLYSHVFIIHISSVMKLLMMTFHNMP
jgi:hypothetical protein